MVLYFSMLMPVNLDARACLKKAFCKMCVTVCGRFCLNEGGVAGYVNRMKVKYAAKWGVQIAGMIFQTRSKSATAIYLNFTQMHDSSTTHIPASSTSYTKEFYHETDRL